MLIPGLDEHPDFVLERSHTVKPTVAQAMRLQDAEPAFDPIESGTVKWDEVNNNPFVIALQPFAALLTAGQGGVPDIGQSRHRLAKGIIEMGRQVVADVVQRRGGGLLLNMLRKDRNKRLGVMVGGAAVEDLTGGVVHESDPVRGPMTVIAVIDLETAVLPRQIRRVARNRLQTRTFVETKQIGMAGVVHGENMRSFGKEVGIDQMHEIDPFVRLETVVVKNPHQGAMVKFHGATRKVCFRPT